MRRLLYVLLAAVLATVVGLGAGLLVSFFVPVCGEDCANRVLGIVFRSLGLSWLVFVPAAVWATRRGLPGVVRSVVGAAALAALILVPALAYHVVALHAEYRRLQALAPVQPDNEFFHMAVTTRAVQGFSDLRSGPMEPRASIPAWERCLIGTDVCDTSPRQVEVRCKMGVMHINEADWAAFTLVPSENPPGAPPLPSMRLCGG